LKGNIYQYEYWYEDLYWYPAVAVKYHYEMSHSETCKIRTPSGRSKSVPNSEVSSFQRAICTEESILGLDEVSLFHRMPSFCRAAIHKFECIAIHRIHCIAIDRFHCIAIYTGFTVLLFTGFTVLLFTGLSVLLFTGVTVLLLTGFTVLLLTGLGVQWNLWIATLWNEDILWNKDTSSGPKLLFTRRITLWNEDTSEIGIFWLVPRVSLFHRFHCIGIDRCECIVVKCVADWCEWGGGGPLSLLQQAGPLSGRPRVCLLSRRLHWRGSLRPSRQVTGTTSLWNWPADSEHFRSFC
jgi:hypothetical protein